MKSLWKYISTIGIHDALKSEDKRRIVLLNQITCIGIITYFLYLTLEIALGLWTVAALVGSFIILFLISFYLTSKRYYVSSKYLAIMIAIATIVSTSVLLGFQSGTMFLLMGIIPIPIIIFKNRNIASGITLLFAIIFFGLYYYVQGREPYLHFDASIYQFFFYTNIAVIFYIIYQFTMYYRVSNEAYELELQKQKKIIEERNEEITDSITYAKRIQEALLPSESTRQAYMPNSFILYKPKDIVSGDFYWIEKVENKILLAAVDCTGHGVPGAMVSVIGFNNLNRAVKEYGLSTPSLILDKINELICETFEASENEVKDGMDISLCCIDLNQQTLEFSGANNPLYIMKNGDILETKGDKQPIGNYDSVKPFTNHRFSLSEIDSFYIFSDGYPDQFGGPKGKKFKYKQFRELLITITDKSLDYQKAELDRVLKNWRGDLEQVDDICIIGVKV